MRLFSAFTLAIGLSLPVFAADVIYKVDTSKSVVNWTGSKLVGKHHGILKFKEGTLTLIFSSCVCARSRQGKFYATECFVELFPHIHLP